jgi:hypothetical protein
MSTTRIAPRAYPVTRTVTKATLASWVPHSAVAPEVTITLAVRLINRDPGNLAVGWTSVPKLLATGALSIVDASCSRS